MSAHLPLDLLRSYADGHLPTEQARAVEQALAQEGPAACEAATYLLVHRLSAPLRAPTAPSRLTFEDLALETAGSETRPLRRRIVFAAAALALLALGAALLARRAHDVAPTSRSVRLAHVPWGADVPAPDPLLLADYRPTSLGRVAWLEDAAAAQALAEASARPLLRYVQHPDCPMCRALEAGPLRDPALLAALEGVVPLRVDVERLPRAEIEALMREGWPHLSVLRPSGKVLGAFPGMRRADDLREALAGALASLAPALPPGWAELSAAAHAQDRRRRAQAALRTAREQAGAAAPEARAALEAERAALGPTPEGEDLARVLEAWPCAGPFPPIEESPR